MPPERRIHGGFDVLLGHVKRADLIPFARMRLEIGLRGLGACLLDGGSPRAVARESKVGGVEARDNGAGERGFRPGIGETEEDPRALAEAPDQPRFGHEFQVPADARLALAEDLGQVLDVQLARGKERQDAKARGLARGAQSGQGLDTGQALRLFFGITGHKDMFIRFCQRMQGPATAGRSACI